MATMTETILRRTVLCEVHRALGARMVDFSGWEMPVQYRGIIEEHQAVRTGVGLFDVSHMGRLLVRGESADDLLQRTVTRDVRKLGGGQMTYTALCREDGGVLDDLVVGRARYGYLVVCNAANREKVRAWLTRHADAAGTVEDISDDWALLGVQGPRAQETLAPVCHADLDAVGYMALLDDARVAGTAAIVTRSGYTAEDGFEIWCHAAEAEQIYRALLDAERCHADWARATACGWKRAIPCTATTWTKP